MIATGYLLDFEHSEEWNNFIKDRDTSKITQIYAGVMYNKTCKGGLSDAFATDTEMINWFKQRENKKYTAYIKKLYITPKVIVAVAVCNGDIFYTVPWNITNGNLTTTIHKKNASNGQYGNPIDVNIRVSANAYKF
jgi:hypothetical protein